MKQVKYRLWCNNKKEWEKDEWHLTSDGIIIDTKRNIEMKKETHFLNQFTGLFDKQGMEIYEGDIVKDLADNIYKVLWRPLAGAWEIANAKCHQLCVMRYMDMFEVIGNIYENPELLGSGQK